MLALGKTTISFDNDQCKRNMSEEEIGCGIAATGFAMIFKHLVDQQPADRHSRRLCLLDPNGRSYFRAEYDGGN